MITTPMGHKNMLVVVVVVAVAGVVNAISLFCS